MAIADDLRKTLTDPTPLYFAAGTADLAVEQARKVPGLIEQLRSEAPARIDAVRNTDPKVVQDRVADQAKEAQARVTEVFGAFDPADLKKLGETAQDLALRSVGVAAEYAVRARETYEKVAERGEQTVRAWRGEAAEEITEIAVAVEPETAPKPAPGKPGPAKPAPAKAADAKAAPKAEGKSESKAAPSKPAAKSAAARKTTPRRTTPRKTTPPSGTTGPSGTSGTSGPSDTSGK
ncbi:hypothetical protein [Streptomyces sp. SID3212]|uniref:hypothetical protein n=1 Tax=Streptomyces sp. SID3212 TaxID=2690259 RepID=UPI001368AF09|nr:hypothetical protein [Streptomyces sp. SID3212]MYV57672.1 hypothetical protein [Streptomyces sp. SID3212]